MSIETMGQPRAVERSDQEVLAEVQDRIWQDEATRAIERSALAVDVDQQAVSLLGQVTSVGYRQRAVELAWRVPGVRAIHNRLVADPELVTEVAQALADDPRTRLSILGVGAFHGWIHLSGEVPDLATRLAAEQVASRVGRVRGVLALPHLPGEHTGRGENRRPIQPHAGQAVFALDGPAGQVEQVVISPASRLVSHIVVGGTTEVNWRPIRGHWIVPIAAVATADDSGVFLSEPRSALVSRPTYNPADLRLPPPDWQLPFPYRAGEIRWLHESESASVPVLVEQFLIANWPAARSTVLT